MLLHDNELIPYLPEVPTGLGNLNYVVYLRELSKLKNILTKPEHLKSAEKYYLAAKYIRSVAQQNNIFL